MSGQVCLVLIPTLLIDRGTSLVGLALEMGPVWSGMRFVKLHSIYRQRSWSDWVQLSK